MLLPLKDAATGADGLVMIHPVSVGEPGGGALVVTPCGHNGTMLANPTIGQQGGGPVTQVGIQTDQPHLGCSTPSELWPECASPTGMTAVQFADSARIIADLARSGALRVPAFRSPPRRPEVDRSIARRDRGAVVSVRRRGRPAVAVHADLIEGIVALNDLDPVEAARFRNQAWASLTVIGRLGEPPTEITGSIDIDDDLTLAVCGVSPVSEPSESPVSSTERGPLVALSQAASAA